MCRRSATWGFTSLAALLVWVPSGRAQTAAPDWRRIGNSALELALPSVATGPVDRVWYSPDGTTLFARTASGRVFETLDLEQWRVASDQTVIPPVATNDANAPTLPERAAKLRASSDGRRVYGFGAYAYRSEDAGQTWSNLTGYKGASILGSGLSDLAISPRDSDELAAAASTGVWRSVDGGLSWTGLNQSLPNLPVRRLYSTPSGTQGVRLSLRSPGTPHDTSEIEWVPGEKHAWKPNGNPDAQRETAQKQSLSQALGANITAAGFAGNNIYAGSADGQLWSSSDRASTWNTSLDHPGGQVESIYVDPKDSRIALAALNNRKSTRVLRTMNGGVFWDDISANLPEGAAHGIAADRASGAVYVATDAGVFFTITDLGSAGRATPWAGIGGNLPASAAMDVRLDAGANQVFVALDGYGVYAAIAPHRLRDVHVVNAADYSARPASPGGVLSVLGTRVLSAQTDGAPVPVLDASDTASQIQVPFSAQGNAVSLALEAAAGHLTIGLPLLQVAPAIFVDPDGTPLILDADSGILLDGSKPAHAKTHIQILATGLGRVTPDWPTGVAAPLGNPPRVAAVVNVFLDGLPLEVKQAILAPGYIGSYLIEAVLPQIVNAGPAELYVEAGGQVSNRVRLSVEP
ncbi:MAG: hypothetical protein ACR2NN_14845 [Bryobacteraceae bacterium]